MPPDSRHARSPGLHPRIFALPQTTHARSLPDSHPCTFIHASMAGSRSTAPLNRSNSVLTVALLLLSDLCYVAIDPYRDCPGRCGAWERSVLLRGSFDRAV